MTTDNNNIFRRISPEKGMQKVPPVNKPDQNLPTYLRHRVVWKLFATRLSALCFGDWIKNWYQKQFKNGSVEFSVTFYEAAQHFYSTFQHMQFKTGCAMNLSAMILPSEFFFFFHEFSVRCDTIFRTWIYHSISVLPSRSNAVEAQCGACKLV